MKDLYVRPMPPTEQPNSEYDDGNIPEIDMPRESNATNVIPDEVPRRDGPGGEGK